LLEQYDFPQDFLDILDDIYRAPASITTVTQIGGWKLGKTAFALLLGELLLDLKIVELIASNTYTDRFEFIEDFTNLDIWLRKPRRKLYLFDEIVEAAQRRRAMSGINVQWVRKIPQLSKGRCQLIVITQSLRFSESAFSSPTFNRGLWTKLSLTTVQFENPRMYDEPYILENVPMTSVKFEPYEFATFNERGIVKTEDNIRQPLTEDQQFKYDFKELKMSPAALGKKYHIDHKTALNRIRDAL